MTSQQLYSFTGFLILVLFSFGLKAQNVFSEQFSSYEIKSINTESHVSILKSKLSGPIYLKVAGYDLELIHSDIIAADYQSINSDGSTNEQTNRALPMNGFTAQGGRVSLSFAEDFVYGFIEDGAETFFIEPTKYYDPLGKPNEFIIYKASDVKETAPKTCAVTEMSEKVKIKDVNPVKSAGLCYDVEYAICNDWSMVTKYTNAAGAENHAIGVNNNVNSSYDTEFADEIRLVIQGQYNSSCSSCDPWSITTNAGSLLNDFRNWAISNLGIPHDVASLWTNRDFDGTTIGIAYVGVICNSNSKYNCLQDWSTNAALKRVMVTHEIGHNFDADHDTSAGFIMSGSVSNTTTWSALSISDIESFYGGINCMSICAGSTPQVQFDEQFSTEGEYATAGNTGPCNEPYTTIQIPVEISIAPSGANIVMNIAVNVASTADSAYDFELVTTSLTFTPAGPLVQYVDVRILDDQIEEASEEIILDLTITSGTATMGPFSSHTLTINDVKDLVDANCCSGGGSITYGSHNYNAVSVYNGAFEDSRSRTLILASELIAGGMGAGFIEELSLNVTSKSSSGAFNDFRIAMANTSMTTLASQSWITVAETYSANHTTALGWNDFTFSAPFYWDGTSNLYIQFCFNNTSVVGDDQIMHTTPVSATGNMTQFQINNGTDGCDAINTGTTYSYGIPIQPRMKISQAGGAVVETGVNSSSSTRIQVGETAHLYSTNAKVIASITNTGSVDIDCSEAKIQTSGTGKQSANFGTGDFTSKTFLITGSSSATYNVTLYYTDAELATWGAEKLNLQLVKSDVPLAGATESNVTIVSPISVTSNVGAGSQIAYEGSFSGFSYFGLTDVEPEFIVGDFENADLVISQNSSGVILKESDGTPHRFYVSSTGVPSLSSTTGSIKACLEIGDLFISSANKGLILRRSGGGYTKISVDNDGAITYTNIASLPSSKISLGTGDFGVIEAGKGIILQNSQGECWKIFVNDSGAITTGQVSCQ